MPPSALSDTPQICSGQLQRFKPWGWRWSRRIQSLPEAEHTSSLQAPWQRMPQLLFAYFQGQEAHYLSKQFRSLDSALHKSLSSTELKGSSGAFWHQWCALQSTPLSYSGPSTLPPLDSSSLISTKEKVFSFGLKSLRVQTGLHLALNLIVITTLFRSRILPCWTGPALIVDQCLPPMRQAPSQWALSCSVNEAEPVSVLLSWPLTRWLLHPAL